MDVKLAPSLMCADLTNLAADLDALAEAGADYLHLDVMDGQFVPNFTLGPDFLRAVRSVSELPMDIHLMVERPELHLHIFEPQPGDIVCVHQEATYHLQRVLQTIRDLGARPAVALNPATSVHTLEHVLEDLDMVLIMTVNPGYAGQKLVPASIPKIRTMRQLLDEAHPEAEIEVDGNVSFATAPRMREAGANIFVGGSSSIFHPDFTIKQAAEKLRSCLTSPG